MWTQFNCHLLFPRTRKEKHTKFEMFHYKFVKSLIFFKLCVKIYQIDRTKNLMDYFATFDS